MSWQEKCAVKKHAQQEALPKEWLLPSPIPDSLCACFATMSLTCGLLTQRDLEITEERDVAVCLSKLRSGEWSCEETTRAVTNLITERATIAHQLVNCLTEFWFDEAIENAKGLDALRLSGATLGPLHGLPVSLKDQFHVEGKELNMGFASWIGQISEHTAEIARCLVRSGAVLYCRTNVPQTLMMGETNNYVYGRTVNPRNRETICGGSSGGEAALIALGGSVLGVGTDIGGSVRGPAALNGLYGLRPTTRRIPYAGAANILLGMENFESTVGPLSSSLSGLCAFFKGVLEAEPWDGDPKVPYIPWREDEFQLKKLGGPNAKLCFVGHAFSRKSIATDLHYRGQGFYHFDGFVHVQPPMERGVKLAVDSLRKAGHEVIDWHPRNYRELVVENQFEAYLSDGGQDIASVMDKSGEPFIAKSLEELLVRDKALSVNQSWQINRRRDQARENFLRQWMATARETSTGRPIDGIICPPGFGPAPKHGQFVYQSLVIYNTLDLPSTVVPVTTADSTLDPVDQNFAPASERDQTVHDIYDPEGSHGLPVSVQLVGRPFREEALLQMTSVLDAAVRAAAPIQ